MNDSVNRRDVEKAFDNVFGLPKDHYESDRYLSFKNIIGSLPSAEPEYEPVTIDDFAKTMSENTIYSFMAWHGEALGLMERQGFVICKKTM